MKLNPGKCKEIVVWLSRLKYLPPALIIDRESIRESSDLKWNMHVNVKHNHAAGKTRGCIMWRLVEKLTFRQMLGFAPIDIFHKWRFWHGNEARIFLVGQYLFPTSKLTCFYVLSLLKSLNNRIIQIVSITLKLTLKTNPNA